MNAVLLAQWCLSSNVGDALMPRVAAEVSTKHVAFADKGPRLLLGGSILNWGDADCIAWGCGVADRAHQVDPKMQIRAVRGPLSRDVALACGAECPEIYGDPALLVPSFLPRTKPSFAQGFEPFELGVVPHYVHYGAVLQKAAARHHSILVIDVLQPLEGVLRALWMCRAVISTSLHGLILADAYGIPCRWAEWPSIPLNGDGMKFRDYFATSKGGTWRDPTPLDLEQTGIDLSLLDHVPSEAWETACDLEALKAAFPGGTP